MTVHRLSELVFPEVRDLDRARTVAILPLGAVEAHGPHLPISTDRVIARAMAEAGARRLSERGLVALLLPPIDYTAAGFAAGFPGTVSLRLETVTAVLVDVAVALDRHGFRFLALANAHFDPAHLRSIKDAGERIASETSLAVAFPDITRRALAERLPAEWQSGACHAGSYEGSIVLARRPELVRNDVRASLAPNPRSLVTAIRSGKTSFEEAGGPDAYFGDPAAASAEEGEATIAVLGAILEEAVIELVGES